MTISGFQDFQEGTIWQSDLAFNFNASIGAGGTHTWPDTGSPTVVCSNWQATQLHVSTIASVNVIARWWNYADATFPLGERRFSHRGTWADTYLNLPNLGPYMNFTVVKDAVGTTSVTLSGVFTNRPVGPFAPPSMLPVLEIVNQSVTQFTDVFVSGGFLYAGSASFYCVTTSTSWGITLFGQEANGTTHIITEAASAEGAGGDRRRANIVLPPMPLYCRLTQLAAGTAQFWVSVVADVFR